MMPGIGFAEMVLLVLVAIVVIGPKELPLMMRKFGRFTGKMRAMAFEFRQGFDELGRQAELEELRKEVADLKKTVGMEDLQREFEEDRANLEKDVNSAMAPAALPVGKPADVPAAQPAASDAKPVAAAVPAATLTAPAAPERDEPEDDFRIDAGHAPPKPAKQETPA
jgi:sec-independent protein translocase protein TatB